MGNTYTTIINKVTKKYQPYIYAVINEITENYQLNNLFDDENLLHILYDFFSFSK